MNQVRYATIVLVLFMVAATGCSTMTREAKFKSARYKSDTDQKSLIAVAWLDDLATHGESVVTSGIHSQYSLPELQEVLPRLKKDIKDQMTGLVANRGQSPEIIVIDKGFVAKYKELVLAFALIDSTYILVDIDPVKTRNP